MIATELADRFHVTQTPHGPCIQMRLVNGRWEAIPATNRRDVPPFSWHDRYDSVLMDQVRRAVFATGDEPWHFDYRA